MNSQGGYVIWSIIRADITSHIDETHATPIPVWARVLGKVALSPALHVVLAFRLSHVLAQFLPTRPLAFVLRTLAVVWGGTEIHPDADIGPGLCLVHSQKVIIGRGVRIGAHARIHQGVTLAGDPGRGSTNAVFGWPVLGDRVTVGADAIVMGPVQVGDGAVIGAQALVLHDVPAGATVVGSPARVIRGSSPSHS